MTAPHHMSWDNFRSTVLIKDQQRVHRVTSSPLIEMFGDGVLNRIGICLESLGDAAVPSDLSKLNFITARNTRRDGRVFLELSTTATALYRQFYHFASAVSERMIVDKMPAADAVAVELKCFADLLAEKSLLSTERQIGLIGELLFLERLVAKAGLSALDSWLGPSGESHDFRYRTREFEVKTTVSPQRIHIINGAEQLLPSAGCSLFLISVLLGPPGAGGGFSLAGKVAELSDQFAPIPKSMTQFASALEACGFRTADVEQYKKQYVTRRPMAIVRIDDAFPAITRQSIQQAIGPLASRIESLEYEVNIEGLEYEDRSPTFEAAISD